MSTALVIVCLGIAAVAYGQNLENRNEHRSHATDRAEKAMGFSQERTTHHFHLTEAGGVIEVRTNDDADTTTCDHIRHHLREISEAFARGDFSFPMMTHGKVPPGVEEMRHLKDTIAYTYVETDGGGKVVVSSANPEARKAVHDFLRFQIEEHHTGDPIHVEE